MATFGERLRELREEQGLTQPELAKALGVGTNTIFVWEKEKRQPGKEFDLFKAAKFFDVSYFYLMGISDVRKEEEAELSEEEVTRMLDEDALIYMIGALKKYRDLSDEMQFMVRQTLENAYKADKERMELRSQRAAERGNTYEDKIIALLDSDYFSEAVKAVFYPENGEKQLFDVQLIAIWPDMNNRIFMCTIILFLPESTEGVDPGRVTALDYENEANRTEKWEKRDDHWAD